MSATARGLHQMGQNALPQTRSFGVSFESLVLSSDTLLRHLKPYLCRRADLAPECRKAVLPHEALALALHRLGSKDEAFRTGNSFGRGDSTAAKWVDVVCHAIVTELSTKVAQPDAVELKTRVNTP